LEETGTVRIKRKRGGKTPRSGREKQVQLSLIGKRDLITAYEGKNGKSGKTHEGVRGGRKRHPYTRLKKNEKRERREITLVMVGGSRNE